MKLLILTQKVDINDDLLGFFYGWIKEFAKHCEKVIVVCLYKGEHNLPENVEVLSLGKEKFSQKSKVCKVKSKLFYIFRFYKYIWRERKKYDKVFVHMNPEYVVLGGVLWKLCGKKIGLWYTHKSVNLKLRTAEKLVDVVFTASKESFRLPSEKVKVVGHGIDVDKFKVQSSKFKVNEKFKIITVGRISPIKDYETLIKAVEILHRNRAVSCFYEVDIVGGPGLPEDEKYLAGLKEIVKEKKLGGIINFIGPVPNKNVAQYLQMADLFINLCPTGGMDKAVLEAMACGAPVIVFNKAFSEILGDYKKELILENKDADELSVKINNIINISVENRKVMGQNLRHTIVSQYSLNKLIEKIVFLLNTK